MRRNGPVRWARHGNGREVKVRRPFYIPRIETLGWALSSRPARPHPTLLQPSHACRLTQSTARYVGGVRWLRVTFEEETRRQSSWRGEGSAWFHTSNREGKIKLSFVWYSWKIIMWQVQHSMQKKLVCIHQGTWMWEANSCLIAMCPPPPSLMVPSGYILPLSYTQEILLIASIWYLSTATCRLWLPILLSQGNVKSCIYVFRVLGQKLYVKLSKYTFRREFSIKCQRETQIVGWVKILGVRATFFAHLFIFVVLGGWVRQSFPSELSRVRGNTNFRSLIELGQNSSGSFLFHILHPLTPA